MTRALRCSSRSSAPMLNPNRIEVVAAVIAVQIAAMLLGLPARAAEEIQCGVLAPVVGRTCAVTPGTDLQTLIQGDVLGDGQIYRGGAVLVDALGNISCSGCGCSAPDATVIRCPETVISPGLINSYDHITFDQTPPPSTPGSVMNSATTGVRTSADTRGSTRPAERPRVSSGGPSCAS